MSKSLKLSWTSVLISSQKSFLLMQSLYFLSPDSSSWSRPARWLPVTPCFCIPHQLRATWISWATSLAIRNGLISLARRMDGATIIAAVVRGSGGWSAGDFAAELVTDIGHLSGWDLAEDELLRYKFFQAFDELMQVGDVGVVLNLNFDVLLQVFVFFSQFFICFPDVSLKHLVGQSSSHVENPGEKWGLWESLQICECSTSIC